MKMYKKILISYLCVSLIPLLLSLFTYFQMENKMRTLLLHDQNQLLRSVQTNLDQNIHAAWNTERLIQQESVMEMLQLEYEISVEQRMNQNILSESLNVMCTQLDYCESAFVYFFRSNRLISEKRGYDSSNIESYLKAFQINQDIFLEAVTQDAYRKLPVITAENGNSYLLVMQTSYDRSFKERLGCIGVIIPLDTNAFTVDNGYFFLTNTQGDFLYGNPYCQLATTQELKEKNQVTIENKKYILSSIPSAYSELIYNFLIEKDFYYEPVTIVWEKMIFELFLYSIVGIIFCIVLSRRAYSPYKNILHILRKQQLELFQNTRNESFNSLEEALEVFSQQHQSLKNQLANSRLRIQNSMISGLLAGHTKNIDILSKYIEDGEPFQILTLFLQNLEKSKFFENVPADQIAATTDILFFSVRNVLEESLLEKRHGVSLTMNGFVVVIFQSEENDNDLEHDIRSAISFLEEQLMLSVCCCVSSKWNNLEDSSLAYQEALTLYENQMYLEDIADQSLYIAHPKEEHQDVSKNIFNLMKKLGDYLHQNKIERAKECLENIFNIQVEKSKNGFMFCQYHYIDILYMIAEYSRRSTESIELAVKRILMQNTLEGMQQELRTYLKETIEDNNDKEDGWIEEVQQFISEQYSDPNLNVSLIASRWNMPLNMISRKFRDSIGHSILDEIHMTRLKNGKQLLAEGKTVKEVSELLGYLDSRAMIRAFKRYEGITPGQLKKEQ